MTNVSPDQPQDIVTNDEWIRCCMRTICEYIDQHIILCGHAVGEVLYAAGLTGSKRKEIEQYALDKLPQYGALSHMTEKYVRKLIRALITLKALEQETIVFQHHTIKPSTLFDKYLTEGFPKETEMPYFPIEAIPTSNIKTYNGKRDDRTEPTSDEYAQVCACINAYIKKNNASLGMSKFRDGLRGLDNKKVQQHRLYEIEGFGSFADKNPQLLDNIFDELLDSKALVRETKYNTLIPGPDFQQFLHPETEPEHDSNSPEPTHYGKEQHHD